MVVVEREALPKADGQGGMPRRRRVSQVPERLVGTEHLVGLARDSLPSIWERCGGPVWTRAPG